MENMYVDLHTVDQTSFHLPGLVARGSLLRIFAMI
jgi:hypothetical protein